MALDGMNLGAGELLALGDEVRVKTHDEMRQAILNKYAKTIAQKNVKDLTPMERAKYDAADELANKSSVTIPTAHYFNKARVKKEATVTDRLRTKILDAMNNTPDFQDPIAMDQASLAKIAKFLEASDWKQFDKLTKDPTGYQRALLDIAKTAQAHGVRGKQKAINAIIDHRVANPIDNKGVGRKISDGVKSVVTAFAAVAGTAISFKPKMAMAKPVLSKVGTSFVGKKGIAAMFGAVVALGAATGVDQDSGVPAISFADIEHEISTVFTGDDVTTAVKTRLVDASTVLSQVAADPSSVAAVDAVEAAALAADALDDKILGKSSVGFEMVQDGIVGATEIVAEARPKLAYKIQEAATQAYFDTGLVPASNLDMAYLTFSTVEHLAYDGLHGTDAVAVDRGERLAKAGVPLSGSAQEIVTLVEEANAKGFTPLMVDKGQSRYNFVVNSPEMMTQIDATGGPNTREQKIMIVAVAITDANGGGNINELGTGEMQMIPRADTIDFTTPVSKEMIARIRADNKAFGLKM